MQHLSTALLIISLVIVVNQGSGVTAQDDNLDDPIAIESKNRAVTIIHNPKYVAQPESINQSLTRPDLPIHKPEQRPPSKPPNIPDKLVKPNHSVDIPRPPQGQLQKLPPPRLYPKLPVKLHHSPNSIYKFPRVIPLPPHHRTYYYKPSRPLVYAASTGKPVIAKSPKFSLPVQVINGIRADFVRPPKINSTTPTTTTTTEATTTTTTQKVLRTKRIWPKRVLDKMEPTLHNTTLTNDITTLLKTNTTDESARNTSESTHRIRFTYRNTTTVTTTVQPDTPSTPRVYRPVTRKIKVKTTTPLPPINFTQLEPNDWVPIMPSHYPNLKRPSPTPLTKRSDFFTANPAAPQSKQMMYLQSFGLVPVPKSQSPVPIMDRKKMVFFKRKRQLNPYYSGYSGKRGRSPMHYMYGDLEGEASHRHPRVVTKIKHHHHHHHHRYIKTVEKPIKVPYKVEIPKPYPVQVEKKVPVPVEKIKVVDRPVPYPVTVEKKVPYPIGIKVPHPVPVKVVEKEYVPKPYPIVHQVPIVKHVKVPHAVPVHVEKKVPYPVEVKVPVPVDRPIPVPVHVEKRVPYPVPVKVLVPQPYPVETKVPYPVQVKVKEPYEVIKHVPVRVPVPQPYPVKVPHPVPVPYEKRVPYPVEVEKKVPVPVEVLVPQRVEVEKRVPVYVPRPYPVEKKVPYPVRVPYQVKVPVKVPIKVPVEVPVYIHHPYQVFSSDDHFIAHYRGNSVTEIAPIISSTPQHTVTVHGNTGFNGFQSRSDSETTTSTTHTS